MSMSAATEAALTSAVRETLVGFDDARLQEVLELARCGVEAEGVLLRLLHHVHDDAALEAAVLRTPRWWTSRAPAASARAAPASRGFDDRASRMGAATKLVAASACSQERPIVEVGCIRLPPRRRPNNSAPTTTGQGASLTTSSAALEQLQKPRASAAAHDHEVVLLEGGDPQDGLDDLAGHTHRLGLQRLRPLEPREEALHRPACDRSAEPSVGLVGAPGGRGGGSRAQEPRGLEVVEDVGGRAETLAESFMAWRS